jgi:hypothetical protein
MLAFTPRFALLQLNKGRRGQAHDEGCPHAGLRHNVDSPAVRLNDGFGDGQAEAVPSVGAGA